MNPLNELLSRIGPTGRPHPYRVAFYLAGIFAVAFVVGAVRLHPIASVLVVGGLVALRIRHRRVHGTRAERAHNLELSRLAEREAIKAEARADAAYKVERARRLAREGFTRAGEWDE